MKTYTVKKVKSYKSIDEMSTYAEMRFGVPSIYAEDFARKMYNWSKDGFPPIDLLAQVRKHGGKKRTTRKILFNQIMIMLYGCSSRNRKKKK